MLNKIFILNFTSTGMIPTREMTPHVPLTPEEIVQSYDTLQLEEVYAVIAYYLANRSEVDVYLREQEEESEALWQEIGGRPDYQEFRERLLNRRNNAQ